MIGTALAAQTATVASPEKGPLSVTLDVAATLNALIWPLVALVLLLWFRDRIPDLLKDLAGRITKVDFAGLRLELAKATSMTPQYESPAARLDLRNTANAIQVSDSTAATFIAQMRDPAPADYAIVDLGAGDQWLTSRLYILAIVFERMKGLKAFVFVGHSSPARRYIGWADPRKVRWALARKYPWLEAAYAGAYAAVVGGTNTNTDAVVVASTGRLGLPSDLQDPSPSTNLIKAFLHGIQWPLGTPPVPAPLPAPVRAAPLTGAEDWTPIDNVTGTREHAVWLTSTLLEDVLGEVLDFTHVTADAIEGAGGSEKARLVLAKKGRFVAVTLVDRRFGYLVDRSALLEQLAEAVRSEASTRSQGSRDPTATEKS